MLGKRVVQITRAGVESDLKDNNAISAPSAKRKPNGNPIETSFKTVRNHEGNFV